MRPTRLTLILVLAVLASLTSTSSSAQNAAKDYGTREPATCTGLRTLPGSRPPTAEEATRFVRCYRESIAGGRISLVENLVVQVGPPRPYQHGVDSYDSIDPRQPVYPIRGSLTAWGCDALRTPQQLAGGFPDNRGKNCDSYREPEAKGICYKSSFKEWSCIFADIHADSIGGVTRNLAPPR
jgi:hypothetical protein